MLSFEDARGQLLAQAQPIRGNETLALSLAAGRVLAQTVTAPMNVPPCATSAMDGYAVRVGEIAAAHVRLPVSQRIAAGALCNALQPGTAARIFTGAPVPGGADAIVMQEQCETLDDGRAVIVKHVPRRGDFIRAQGEDIQAGRIVLDTGRVLRPPALGLLASLGIAAVEVQRRLRVAVFFTGNELVMPGERCAPGKIYNSNRFVLCAQLQQLGCQVSDLGIVPDELDATRTVLRNAAAGHDVIMSCGGVSVGEEDHVKHAVQREGQLDLWQIAMKPGKPLAYGRIGNSHFIGLPGNPVSSFVTFATLAAPFIARLQGMQDVVRPTLTMRADFSVPKKETRREFLRVKRNAQGGLDLFPNQGSAVLTSCAWADGLVSRAPGQTIAPGDRVDYLPFDIY